MKEFVQVKTSDLSGQALDWVVTVELNGKCLLSTVFPTLNLGESFTDPLGESFTDAVLDGRINPTKDWVQCGLLIDEYGIEFKWLTDATIEAYSYTLSENRSMGSDHREAACRLIAMELGETVMVPSILVK